MAETPRGSSDDTASEPRYSDPAPHSRSQIERELRASQARLAGIVDNAEDAIICVDEAQFITLFNHGAEKIFGYRSDEIIGKPLSDLIPERFRNRHSEHVTTFGRGEVSASRMGSRGQITGKRKDGSEFPAEATILKQESQGRIEFTTILRDASERSRIEDRLEQLVAERTRKLHDEMRRNQNSQAALAHLQRMESLGALTGGIAHDFNNLLTVISGNLELIGMDLEDVRSRKYLDEALRAVEIGARLNQRLMTFAKQRKLAPAPINLNEQVIGVRELLRRSLGETITLTVVLADELWTVKADPSEVENALLNLAVNARDAMPAGGKLTVSTENMTVGPAATSDGILPGDFVVLSVSDTGTGIPPEILPRVFDPFFTTKESGKGTGLGLPTIYGFVKQSGGHVRLESAVGAGTTVSIYLPRVAGNPAAELKPASPRVGLRKEQKTILIVEDNPEVRRITIERVETLGYRVIACSSGKEALEHLEKVENIDLVFSDVVMPGGISGIDLARICKKRWPNKKLLLTSGYSGLDEGDDIPEDLTILEKPYNRQALAAALSTALGSG
jgi:PAS domain S-box-containing protein